MAISRCEDMKFILAKFLYSDSMLPQVGELVDALK